MDSRAINPDSTVNGVSQDSPSSTQVATEVNTYEDIVGTVLQLLGTLPIILNLNCSFALFRASWML